jgi:hypothetical protein
MPISFLKSGASNNFSAGARAIAGFTSRAVCDMPPVFICNPYETAGMSDSEATQALETNMALPSVQRQLVRLDPTKSGPGQFGYLVPPDNCNGASCLENWIALTTPKTCYQKAGVDLNTGFRTSVINGFNVRFDMYNGSLQNKKHNASYAPAINVRKGFTGTGCNAAASPYLNAAPRVTPAVYPNATTTTAVGDFSTVGNCNGNNPNGNPCVVKNVPSAIVSQVKTWLTTNAVSIVASGLVSAGSTVTGACLTATDLTVNPCKAAKAPLNSLIMPAAAISIQSAANMTVGLQTTELPLDTSLYGNTNTFGNGQWDCDSYWRINHGSAPPDMSADITDTTGQVSKGGVCSTPTNTTVSRYHVYLYENANAALINQYSLPASASKGENGAPQCSGSGVGASTTQPDRRLIYSAVINCLANGPFGGGQTANNIPVAGFAKVFMTQPIQADGTTVIYGEMSGLVGSLDSVKILNQVQLYR